MRLTYGDDESQFAELSRPDGASKGVVVVIHGGFWKAEYDLELADPWRVPSWNAAGRRGTSSTGASATAAVPRRPATTSMPPSSASPRLTDSTPRRCSRSATPPVGTSPCGPQAGSTRIGGTTPRSA